jgi:preprotein translocase subunit SecF
MKWNIQAVNKPLGMRIRAFFEDLFTSRHVKFLEAELVRVRAEKDAEIQQLRQELQSSYRRPVQQTQATQWPDMMKRMANAKGSYESELQAHIEQMQKEEQEEKKPQ